MLKEIQSKVFKSHGNIRPKIEFKPGLNTTLGPGDFDNSIGKSTFLMCIDFAFGGNDYKDKLKDVVKNVGDHSIEFAHEFDKVYYFSRSTDNFKIVTVCDSDYNPTEEKWSIDQFNAWLKEKYKITNELTFRGIVSRHFRIYNRDTLFEHLPLKQDVNEPDSKQIIDFIKLFNLYGPIRTIDEEAALAKDKKSTFSDAQKFEFIPKITKTKFNENIKRIEELESKKLELADKSTKGLLELDSEKAQEISKIKSELSVFKRQRGKLYTQLDLIKKDKDFETTPFKGDFEELEEFFPNGKINIEKLKTIESFHSDISSILKSEIKKSEKDIWNLINLLNDQIRSLEEQLTNLQVASHVSKIVLDEYSQVDKELQLLKRENEYYEKYDVLSEDSKNKNIALNDIVMEQSKVLKESLNSEMQRVNSFIFGRNINAPNLEFLSTKSYEFTTPDDEGTGTQYKGVIIFDLATMHLTDLPVIVHDSVMFKNISKSTIEKIFELYSLTNNQIFVAFDNLPAYTEKTQQIISDSVILELSGNGNELYGWNWGKGEKND